MAENRYHDLLGLPEEVQNPDFYQLLGLRPADSGDGVVEEAFKRQMNRLQHLHSPKHKEFIEFLKGEVRRARKILSDPARRTEYDEELREGRLDQLRKYMSHLLVDGTLSTMAEISLISEGQNIGLPKEAIEAVIEQELKKAGASRVKSSKTDPGTQEEMNTRVRIQSREVESAKLEALLSQARVKRAEWKEKKAQEMELRAEEQIRAAAERDRKAKARLKAAIVREQVSAERQKKAVEAATEEARAKIEAQDRIYGRLREERAFLYGALLSLILYVVLQSASAAFPEVFEFVDRATQQIHQKLHEAAVFVRILTPLFALVAGLLLLAFSCRIARVFAYLFSPVVAALLFTAVRLVG